MQRIVYTRQQELPLGIDYAPDIVRRHGLRDAHIQPLVARHKGESFRVHARDAWGYPSLELRAGNSWPAVTLDCDLPTVIESLHSLRSKFPLPYPNMVVERRSNSGIAMQAGFSRDRQFTGENPHGPHRCGSWRGSPNTTGMYSVRMWAMRE